MKFFTDIFSGRWDFLSGNLLGAGIFSLLIGTVIILVPEILIAFIASIFWIAGLGAIYWSWQIRKSRNQPYEIKINLNE
jgi:hypothetical protein